MVLFMKALEIYNLRYTFCLFWLVFLSALWGSFSAISAQPDVEIVLVEPDVRRYNNITLGEYLEIKFIARTSQAGLQVEWTLEGPGQLIGTTRLGRIYEFPKKLAGASQEVSITVMASDLQGHSAQDHVIFALLAPQSVDTPTPPPTVSPTSTSEAVASPTPTAFPVEEMLRQAENYARSKQYTTPQGKNVFEVCQTILQHDPDNKQARDILYRTLAFYKKNFQNLQQSGDTRKAQTYYQSYLKVAEYMIDTLGEQSVEQELQQLQALLNSQTPEPTPVLTGVSPIPVATRPTPVPPVLIWKPECSPVSLKFEEVQRIFSNHLEEYKALREQERQGMERNAEIQIAINSVVCDLLSIEDILEQHYEQNPDDTIKRRIADTREIRTSYEEEMRYRLGIPE